MAATRRTQLLMDPDEFRQLRALARRKKTSVAELIRTAVRTVYLTAPPDRKAIVEDILKMQDMLRACGLLERYPRLPVRDAIHVATMLNNGLQTIVSVDADFDQVVEIRRVEPGSA